MVMMSEKMDAAEDSGSDGVSAGDIAPLPPKAPESPRSILKKPVVEIEVALDNDGEDALEPLEVDRWSTEIMNPADCRLACLCPCVAAGLAVWNSGLGRPDFFRTCIPVGFFFSAFLFFLILPYLASGGGECLFPKARTEFDTYIRLFGGECNGANAAFIVLSRIAWPGFALALAFSRRKLARQLGIKEGICPALFGQCCCCYACLLGTELRTVREVAVKRRLAAATQSPAPKPPIVGPPVTTVVDSVSIARGPSQSPVSPRGRSPGERGGNARPPLPEPESTMVTVV